ncbi:MAG: hypothetical protein SVO01_00580 [Thermotogota bacterium]|nr:hypothetical protein [Thermotogota bacterium]
MRESKMTINEKYLATKFNHGRSDNDHMRVSFLEAALKKSSKEVNELLTRFNFNFHVKDSYPFFTLTTG